MFKWLTKWLLFDPDLSELSKKIENLIFLSPGSLLPSSVVGQIAVLGFVKDHELLRMRAGYKRALITVMMVMKSYYYCYYYYHY